jgi:glucokinase
MKHALGIDLGGTELRIALVAENGSIISQSSTLTAATDGPAAVLDQMRSLIDQTMRGHDTTLEGIGIGSPGPLDPFEGVVIYAPNLHHWSNVPLRALVSEMTGLDAELNNDGNAGALGEFHFGAGQGYHDIVYVSIGTGIGGGIIVNGRLLQGRRGLAAEMGHMSISENGPVCGCGSSGCWEALASGSVLSRLAGGPVSPTDASNQMLLDQEARYLGIGITNLLHLFSPDCVILGGGVSKLFDQLIGHLRETVEQRAMRPFRDVPIVPAKLGKNAGLVGAASLILRPFSVRERVLPPFDDQNLQ